MLEDLLVRKYFNGGMFGIGFVLLFVFLFKIVFLIVGNEKYLEIMKEGKSFILLKFVIL